MQIVLNYVVTATKPCLMFECVAIVLHKVFVHVIASLCSKGNLSYCHDSLICLFSCFSDYSFILQGNTY